MSGSTKTFLITYNVSTRDPNGKISVLEGKQMRVKNQMNDFFAKVNLEGHLKKKYGESYVSLTVTECKEDFSSMFDDYMKNNGTSSDNPFMNGNGFGDNNPFNDLFGGLFGKK